MSDDSQPQGRTLQPSGIFQPVVIEDIQTKAETGLYRIRGYGTLRQRRWATFDDLTFLPCSLTRIPLEGYREKCSTTTVLGKRYAAKPIALDIPVMITGMSWGALSYNAKVALARGAAAVGSSNTTGDGGMLQAERENSKTLVYEVLPSRYGINVHDLRRADAIELTIGQGAKPGTGGLLLGSKVSATIAKQRDLPVGVDQRSPARHPDFLGPDDMIIKIEELREATDYQVPIFVKMGASRVSDDVKLAVKAGADVIVVDGMQGDSGCGLRSAGGPGGLRAVWRGPTDHCRRHSRRGGRGQGHGSGSRCCLYWHRGADCAELQQGVVCCRLPRARYRTRLLPPLPYRTLPGGHYHPGSGIDAAPGHGTGRRARSQFLASDDPGDSNAGTRLRQVGRSRSRTGGHGRSFARGVCYLWNSPDRDEKGLWNIRKGAL